MSNLLIVDSHEDDVPRAGRFIPSVSAEERVWAAKRYVSKMTSDQLAWLYRKPYQYANGQSLFPELYSVLNSLQALELKKGDHILEIGSGPGWVTELLILLGVSVTCVEPAEDMVAIAKDRLTATIAHHRIGDPPRVDFLQTTFEEAEVPTSFFDGILFHESLHHVIDERHCVAKAFDTLKEGGRLVICEWCWIPGEASLESALVREMDKFGTMESPFTQTYLETLLTEAGFTDITRYHSINGFVPVRQGSSTVASMAQAPAGSTNNLSAIRPFTCATSRVRGAVDPALVLVSTSVIEWARDGRRVCLNVSITNNSSAILLGAGLGMVTVSLCSGQLGAPGFVEAGRIPIVRNVVPNTIMNLATEYVVPPREIGDPWRIELVAEGVVWLDLLTKPELPEASKSAL